MCWTRLPILPAVVLLLCITAVGTNANPITQPPGLPCTEPTTGTTVWVNPATGTAPCDAAGTGAFDAVHSNGWLQLVRYDLPDPVPADFQLWKDGFRVSNFAPDRWSWFVDTPQYPELDELHIVIGFPARDDDPPFWVRLLTQPVGEGAIQPGSSGEWYVTPEHLDPSAVVLYARVPAAVPTPASIVLMALGLAALAMRTSVGRARGRRGHPVLVTS